MAEQHDRFWEIISGMTACMVTTYDDGVLRSRPMAPYIDQNDHLIRFMTDANSAKVFELSKDSDIALSFVDMKAMLFASASGKGKVVRDRSLIKELWGPYADVFFGGDAQTADVVIIEVDPTQAEYWDNDKGSLSLAVEMSRAYFTDKGPDLGENVKIGL